MSEEANPPVVVAVMGIKGGAGEGTGTRPRLLDELSASSKAQIQIYYPIAFED